MEGIRFFRLEKGGEYLYDFHSKGECNGGQYVIQLLDGACVPCPWDEVTSGLAVRNRIYDHWDIYLRSGNKLTFLDGKEKLKKFVFKELTVSKLPLTLHCISLDNFL